MLRQVTLKKLSNLLSGAQVTSFLPSDWTSIDCQLSVTTSLRILKVETFPPRCNIKWLLLQTNNGLVKGPEGSTSLTQNTAAEPETKPVNCSLRSSSGFEGVPHQNSLRICSLTCVTLIALVILSSCVNEVILDLVSSIRHLFNLS